MTSRLFDGSDIIAIALETILQGESGALMKSTTFDAIASTIRAARALRTYMKVNGICEGPGPAERWVKGLDDALKKLEGGIV